MFDQCFHEFKKRRIWKISLKINIILTLMVVNQIINFKQGKALKTHTVKCVHFTQKLDWALYV